MAYKVYGGQVADVAPPKDKYTLGKYSGGDYSSQAAAIVDAGIAQGKALNKNARAAAIRDYANMLADLAAARDANQTALGQYAVAARARQSASMASRGMDVGEGSTTAEAATSMLHEGKLAEILAQYQRGELQAARDRDNHFDEARNNDLAMERARAGKVAELDNQLSQQDYQRWITGENMRLQVAKMNADAEYQANVLKYQTDQNAAMVEDNRRKAIIDAMKGMDASYGMARVAQNLRAQFPGITDQEILSYYGFLQNNSNAYGSYSRMTSGSPLGSTQYGAPVLGGLLRGPSTYGYNGFNNSGWEYMRGGYVPRGVTAQNYQW